MGKHHTKDYKLSAVRYALKTDNQVETCEVFDCKRQSLQRWIQEYEPTGSITKREHHRKSRKMKKGIHCVHQGRTPEETSTIFE